MATPANSFFIGSSSFLQVTSTCIKTWVSLNFFQIPPLTLELSALEHKKEINICCSRSSAFIFDWIFFILSGIEDNHKVLTEFEFGVDWTNGCRVSCP